MTDTNNTNSVSTPAAFGLPASMFEGIFSDEVELSPEASANVRSLALALTTAGHNDLLDVPALPPSPVDVGTSPLSNHPDHASTSEPQCVPDSTSTSSTPVFDPIETLCGVQQRLLWLSDYDGECTGVLDVTTIAALRRFQARVNIETTGYPDGDTCKALLQRTMW